MCGASLAARSTVLFKEIAGQSYRSQRIRRKMDHQSQQAISYIVFMGRDFRGCGKIPILSFRGRILPEESAFFLGFAKKQIPRCARDDNKKYFFRSLFSRDVREFEEQGPQPLP